MRFDFRLDEVCRAISKSKAERVLIQLPEGLKQHAPGIVKSIEQKTKANCIVSGETCWGGCDIDINEAKSVRADLIVHFGHVPFIKINYPIHYVPVADNKDLLPLAKKSLAQLQPYTCIGLLGSIQHMHKMEEIVAFYKKNGKKTAIPQPKGYAYLPGHVVGCEYSGIKLLKKSVDAIVVIGNQFHALGAALAVPQKPVFLLDTYNNEAVSMDSLRDRCIRQRAIAIKKFEEAKKVGIIIGLKAGQHFGAPSIIKKSLELQGKEVILITMREMTPEKIYNFYHVEGFVELACPRIAVDDYGKYRKPILTLKEALVAAGKKQWEDLLEEGFL